uniref:DUF1279 domain-containing protein n=1 Tax=Strongyloides stercoralis TaxID=6248 RepID=A0A0K0EFD7_STRER
MLISRCAIQFPKICRTVLQQKSLHLIKNHELSLISSRRLLSTSPKNLKFSFSMDEDTKNKKLKGIIKEKIESPPTTAAGKLKYYIKRYGYIAIPVYILVYGSFLFGFYCLVKSGVDIVNIMEQLKLPSSIVDKVRNTSPEASALVTAFLLNKLCGPIRLILTLGGTQLSIKVLRRFNLLKTAKEVEFKFRSDYSNKKQVYKLRYGNVKRSLNRKLEQYKDYKKYKK